MSNLINLQLATTHASCSHNFLCYLEKDQKKNKQKLLFFAKRRHHQFYCPLMLCFLWTALIRNIVTAAQIKRVLLVSGRKMTNLFWLSSLQKAFPKSSRNFRNSLVRFHSLGWGLRVAGNSTGIFLPNIILNIIIILYIDMKRIMSLLFIPIYKHVQVIHLSSHSEQFEIKY